MLESVLREQCRLDPAKAVLAGISGGPDSLCLLGVLHSAGYQVIVAYFNHQLRPEADQEAESVSELAQILGFSYVTDSANVRDYADMQGLSIEEAARTLRYRFLFAEARKKGAQAVAVGHTADDQVETVLMHLLRGAGLAGLKGMEPITHLPVFDPEIPLIRPLLSIWREETEAYCREHGLKPHIDATNIDQVYFRNRLRYALIPVMEKYNPRFKESILRTAQTLQDDYVVLQEMLDALWKKVFIESGKDWLAFDRHQLANISTSLRCNLIRRAGEALRPKSRDFGYAALERAANYVISPAGKQADFVNGLYLFAEHEKIYLAAYEADLPFAQWPQINDPVSIIGKSYRLANGWILNVDNCVVKPDRWFTNSDPWNAWIDASSVKDALTARSRRPGDRFTPLGMDGKSIKLQDFFVNVKLPVRARFKWPLICVGDEIAWIPGYRLAHPFRVTEKTTQVIHLTLQRV